MRVLNNILNSAESFDMWKQSILLCYRGSIAHGTHIPNSNPNSIDDKDIFGIAMPSSEYYFGLKEFAQFERFEGVWDVLIYDFNKAIRLISKCNPNVIQSLWTPEDMILKTSDIYRKLVANREMFLSKTLIYKAFCGYSHGQLYKMEHAAYKGYMGKKRKGLVDKYGYDTKNAQHLIRLLRMGSEALETGQFNIKREDAGELKQIKKGEWAIEKVKKEADKLFIRIKHAYENSKLSDKVDIESIDKLVQEINYNYYYPEM